MRRTSSEQKLVHSSPLTPKMIALDRELELLYIQMIVLCVEVHLHLWTFVSNPSTEKL